MKMLNAATRSEWIAVAAMLGSTFCYLLGDTLVKLASETLPVTQIVVVRGLIAILLILLAAIWSNVLFMWRTVLQARILLRGACDAAATLLFTNTLANMRIADATAIINAVPIAATLMAIAFLRERVGANRWAAILIGFAGVLFVLQPGTPDFNIYGLLAVGAMLAISGREVLTRGIHVAVPSLLVTLWSAVAVTGVGGLAGAATGGWVAPSPWEMALLTGAAVFLFGAYHLSVVSLRLGEVSFVGPFRYSIIVWGLGVGFIVWGDIPDAAAITGMALITISGIVVLRRT
jgi:drug/metabolite transporter (DMT)-like permease